MKNIQILTTVIAVLLCSGSLPRAMASDGESKTAICAGCHGPNGQSAVPDNPILAAQSAVYITGALDAYMSGARNNEVMKTMAQRLSTGDVESITAYYAAQSPYQSTLAAVGDAAAGQAKAAACAGCHGPNGRSVLPMYPSLAGQHAVYLSNATKAYKSGARNNPTMSAMVAALSDQDIENIAAYYASQ